MADAKTLWADYLFLTQEMEKFIQNEDHEMFFELMSQRERIQAQIDDSEDKFRLSEEGRRLIADLRNRNIAIIQRMKAILSRMQQQQNVSQAYEGYGSGRIVGARLDNKS